MNPIKSSRKAFMKKTGTVLLGGVIGLLASTALAADVAGEWRAEFDSQDIAFTREVGDFAKTDFQATRVEATAANPVAGQASNAPVGNGLVVDRADLAGRLN